MEYSVVIPAFNRCESLRRALLSVDGQTLPAKQVLVVDDGSTDDTVIMVRREFPGVQLICQENQGVSAARNTAIRAISTDWIAFLDSDDYWHSDKLERQSLALRAEPDLCICHCDEIWLRHGRRWNPKMRHRKQGGWIYRQCLPRCVISPSAVVIHRQVFERVGLFDESLPACEDYDMWLRICRCYPVLFCPQTLLTKTGGHEDQLSQRYWGMDRFRIRALQNILNSDALGHADRVATIETLLTKLSILHQGALKRNEDEWVARYGRLLTSYRVMLDDLVNETGRFARH